MASITVETQGPQGTRVRALNILRDLPQVADLVELCFSTTMDDEGQTYLQQMRRASRDNDFLRWAGRVMDSTSLPLSGFVWEENGKIVGNASLVYQTYQGKKMALLANVATHPDYRRRGIGRALTERAMIQAWQRGAKELWLHVRDDNPTAIRLYEEFGFLERARRTTYRSGSISSNPPFDAPSPDETSAGITLSKPNPDDWPLQYAWLKRAHPDELSWYVHWNWDALGPGLWNWLHRMFFEIDVRQWTAVKDGRLLATASWVPTSRTTTMLWLGSPLNGMPAAVKLVLKAARHSLAHHRRLTVEYPAGEMTDAIQSAGFSAFRTLIWMRASATS